MASDWTLCGFFLFRKIPLRPEGKPRKEKKMYYRPYKQPNDGWMFAAIWITLGAICILCAVRSANYSKMMRAEHERTIHQDSEGEK